ncbi:uncharacterized protein LOC135375670 [Ornithodoros turicata]|uniref:uncharacterized protein LOC135375670 n=1 Tax=Ornithodoros turicata TaxID=34597 RepID=UPI003138E82E
MGDADRVRLSFRNGSSSPTGSMTTLGRIEPFDEASTDWNTYAERVEQFFIANAVSEERKTAAFLSIIEDSWTNDRDSFHGSGTAATLGLYPGSPPVQHSLQDVRGKCECRFPVKTPPDNPGVSRRNSRRDLCLLLRLSRKYSRNKNAKHATTGESPANLLLRRSLRTRLDLIRPSVAESVATSQLRQSGRAGREATFADGQHVYARDYQGASKWRRATVVCRRGPVSYKVQVPSGSIWRRHLDQLRPEGSDDFTSVPSQEVDNSEDAGDPAKSVAQEVSPPERQPREQDMSDAASSTSAARRYPERVRRPPDRLTVV